MGRADRLPTPEQLREAMSVDLELRVIRDRLAHMHPDVFDDIEQYLKDYCAHMEYGSGDLP